MKILIVSAMQIACGIFIWICYLALSAIVESGNWTPFGIFGLDILKSIAMTIVVSAGLTAFAFGLLLFRIYGE